MSKGDEQSELTPRLRFPEFRDTGDWEPKQLGALTTKVGSGVTPRGGSENYLDIGRPFIRSQNVGWGSLLLDDIVYINDATHATFNSTELVDGDVLLNITGASIGRSAIANEVIAGGNVNQHVCIIRTDPHLLNGGLLNQYLISHDGQAQIESFQAGGNRQGLNFGQIRSLTIPLPPNPAEQRKIAACLGSLDDLIAAEERKLASLRRHKTGLMQQLFPRPGETQSEKRFPEFIEAGEWEPRTLDGLIDVASGQVNPTEPPYCDMPHVSGEHIVSNGGGLTELKSAKELGQTSGKYVFGPNDLLYSKIRPALNKVADPTIEGTCSADIYPIRPITGDLTRTYLLYLLLSDAFLHYAIENSARSKIPKLNRTALLNFTAYLPEPPEQQHIGDCLAALDARLSAQVDRLESLRQHKRALMQQLFPTAAGKP